MATGTNGIATWKDLNFNYGTSVPLGRSYDQCVTYQDALNAYLTVISSAGKYQNDQLVKFSDILAHNYYNATVNIFTNHDSSDWFGEWLNSSEDFDMTIRTFDGSQGTEELNWSVMVTPDALMNGGITETENLYSDRGRFECEFWMSHPFQYAQPYIDSGEIDNVELCFIINGINYYYTYDDWYNEGEPTTFMTDTIMSILSPDHSITIQWLPMYDLM